MFSRVELGYDVHIFGTPYDAVRSVWIPTRLGKKKDYVECICIALL